MPPGTMDQRRIESDRLGLLLGQMPSVLVANVANPLIFWLAMGPFTDIAWLGWVLAQVGLSTLRWLVHGRLRRQLDRGDLEVVGRQLVVHSLLSGAIWGAGAAWLLEPRPASLLAWIFLIGGMVTAAAGTTAVHLGSFLAFAVPALSALITRLVLLPPESVGPMPLFVLMFGVLMVGVAHRTHRSLGESFRLRHENTELITELAAARSELERSNQYLESQVRARTAELAAERARLAQWIRDAPDGLLTLADERVLACNPAMALILERQEAELTGQRLHDLKMCDDAMASALLEGCRMQGRATLETSIEVDGARRYLELHATRAADQARRIEIVVRDVTERRLAQEQARAFEDNAHRAARLEAIRRLAGGVAHEFNNLLAVILGTLESLFESQPSQTFRHGLEEIQDAVLRAAAVTRQLVSISHRRRGKRQRVELDAFVRAQRATVERLVGQELRVVIEVSEHDLEVVADWGQMEEALYHVVVYLTAMQRADTRDDRIVLRVHAAMSPEDAVTRAVLDVSYQGPSARSAHEESAIELAVARRLVEEDGGLLDACELGERSLCIRLGWPLARDAELREPARTHSDVVPATRRVEGIVALVVDDEPTLLELAATALRSRGFTVLTASNAGAARQLEAQHKGPIHLLLTDVVMPGTDGPSLATELRRHRPELKVCFMSGYTATYLEGSLGEWAGTPLLEKPFRLDRLVAVAVELVHESELAAGASG
jgi:two-component system cell cycle sensor histidine kinase/response regulator CckA